MLKKLVLLVVVLAPVACGFHLRGGINLPAEIVPLYIEHFGVDNALSRELRNLLSQASADSLADNLESAAAELVIDRARTKRRVIAVDSRGRARQYELSYTVSYSIRAGGASLSKKKFKRELRIKRELFFDPESVLAISHEQEMLYEDMRKDAARLILQQLAAIGKETAQP